MQILKNKKKTITINISLIVVSLISALLGLEILLRTFKRDSALHSAHTLPWMQDLYTEKPWIIDPDFGFRPVLGSRYYNEFGTQVNSYKLKKEESVKRLLFIGDSVTARARIINGIKHFYGDERFEYWNAGVESFNIVQEVKFYKKYNFNIKSDHVILTFLPNDFQLTPVVFFDKDNRLVAYAPKLGSRYVNPFLFKNSYLYRLILGIFVSMDKGIHATAVEETKRSLAELKKILDRDDISFTVLISPILAPYSEWSLEDRDAIYEIKKILQDLDIRYFDLSGILNKAISEKVKLGSTEEDLWHPSDELSLYFARYLYDNQFLD